MKHSLYTSTVMKGFISVISFNLYNRVRFQYTQAKLCLTLFVPMDYSPSGSSVHRILQAKILELVTIPYSRGSSQFRD